MTTPAQPPADTAPRQFVSFIYYAVDPVWRRLPESERAKGKAEFADVLQSFTDKLISRSYALTGLKAEAELGLWLISLQLESLQNLQAALLRTGLGRYLRVTASYLAMTKRSTYIDKISPEHEESRTRIVPGKYKYLFVYPFVKTREWYLLSQATRQGMMDEHIQIGNRYPSVKLNTTYSFGLDDQEFVVAFETNKPQDFLDLVMDLRGSEGSRYTLRDTPIYTCIAKPIHDALDALGG